MEKLIDTTAPLLVGFHADLFSQERKFLTADPVVWFRDSFFVAQNGEYIEGQTLLLIENFNDQHIHLLASYQRRLLNQGEIVFIVGKKLLADCQIFDVDAGFANNLFDGWEAYEDWFSWTTGEKRHFDIPRQQLSDSAAKAMHDALDMSHIAEAERLFDVFEGFSYLENLSYLSHLAFYYQQLGKLEEVEGVISRAKIFGTATESDLRQELKSMAEFYQINLV